MAVGKAIATNDVVNGGAVLQPNGFGNFQMYNPPGRNHIVTGDPAQLTELENQNARYKFGGSTGFERPGSNFT